VFLRNNNSSSNNNNHNRDDVDRSGVEFSLSCLIPYLPLARKAH